MAAKVHYVALGCDPDVALCIGGTELEVSMHGRHVTCTRCLRLMAALRVWRRDGRAMTFEHYESLEPYERLRQQEERALRRAKGLCLLCNTPKLPGYVMCQKHRTIYRPKSAHPAAQRGTR